MKYVLDAACMQERKETHKYLKEVLNLPDYYGNNLDALYDCLYDMDKPEIEICNMNEETKNGYIANVLPIMDAAHVKLQIVE